MANILVSRHLPTKQHSSEENKENLNTPTRMKNFKLGNSSILSPFSKQKPFKILSDEDAGMVNLKQKKGHPTPKVKDLKRKSLATLQQSTEGDGNLAGQNRRNISIKDAFNLKKKTISVMKKGEQTEKENLISHSSTKHEDESSTEESGKLIEDALALMKGTEKETDSYWKKMAEERRIALEETLEENETLYNELDEKNAEIDRLKKALSDAECYKLLYNNLLADSQGET